MMTDPAASGPGIHLDPDRLADLFEGLLEPAAADEARAHLASCALCAADFALIAGEADLAERGGPGALGDLLPPTPIPQDVVARVEAALYREPPLSGASGASGSAIASSAPATAVPAGRPRRRRFGITLGALAGATLVVAGGIGVVTALNSGNSDHTTSSNSAVAGGAPSSESGNGSHAAGQAPKGAMSPQLGAPEPDSTGTQRYSDESLVQQAQALLTEHVQTPAAGTNQTARPQCPPPGVANSTRPLASTQTEYQGRPAWLMIYAQPGNATVADVYVVDLSTCTPGNPGQVADHFTIARP